MKEIIENYVKDKDKYGSKVAMDRFLAAEWKGKTRLERIKEIIYRVDYNGYYVDDLVNEVVLGLMEREVLERVDLRRSSNEVEHFFYVSCRNIARSAFSSFIDPYEYEYSMNSYEGGLEDDEEVSDVLVGLQDNTKRPDDLAVNNDFVRSIEDEVNNILNNEQEEIFQMWCEGFTHQEIADGFGLDRTAITKRMSEIRRVLRENVSKDLRNWI